MFQLVLASHLIITATVGLPTIRVSPYFILVVLHLIEPLPPSIAQVLILRELAVHTPTLFYQQIQQFFDNIFIAVRDPKVSYKSRCCNRIFTGIVGQDVKSFAVYRSVLNRNCCACISVKLLVYLSQCGPTVTCTLVLFVLRHCFPQPLIRERSVLALRACLRLTAQRESKEDVNSLNYQVDTSSHS